MAESQVLQVENGNCSEPLADELAVIRKLLEARKEAEKSGATDGEKAAK